MNWERKTQMKGLWSTILPDLLRETQSHLDWALLSLWSTAGFVRGVGSLFLVYWDTLLSLQHEAMFYPYMSARSLCLSDFQSQHIPPTSEDVCVYQGSGVSLLDRCLTMSDKTVSIQHTLWTKTKHTHTNIQLKILEIHHKVIAFSRGPEGHVLSAPSCSNSAA